MRIAGDTAFVERFYAKELRLQTADGGVVTRDEDIALFAARAVRPEFIRPRDLRVAVYGATAIVTGVDSLKGTYRGHPGEMALQVHRRADSAGGTLAARRPPEHAGPGAPLSELRDGPPVSGPSVVLVPVTAAARGG